MRDTFSLNTILKACEAWDEHKTEWLKTMQKANQPVPEKETISGYRDVWLEGYMNAHYDATNN